MKKTTAVTELETKCECPYCGEVQDIRSKLNDYDCRELRYDKGDIDVEIECEECGKTFIIDEIEF